MLSHSKTVFAIALATSCAAVAAAPAGSSAIAARKANFKEIGGSFKAINDEIKSGAPDLNSLRPSARDLASRATASLKHFPKGSGPQAGKTRAKAILWTQYAEFTQLQKQLVAQTAALSAAAAGGKVAELAAASKLVGATCKSCHDKFRETE